MKHLIIGFSAALAMTIIASLVYLFIKACMEHVVLGYAAAFVLLALICALNSYLDETLFK